MNQDIDPKTDHENTLKFHQHLDQSQDAVWQAARWLQSTGRHVLVTPMTKTPKHSEWKQHADDGDLYVQQRIEVKRRSVHFTGPHDWPHGDRFFVCAKHAFDRAVPKPYAYMIFNSSMTHVAIVRGESHPQWGVAEQVADKRYQKYAQDFYTLPTNSPAISWVETNIQSPVGICTITGQPKNKEGEYVW